jgi:hypothetical protein
MANLVRGGVGAADAEAARATDAGALVVEVSSGGALAGALPAAAIRVCTGDPALGDSIERAVAASLEAEIAAAPGTLAAGAAGGAAGRPTPRRRPVVRLMSRGKAERARVEGALAVVEVTARSARWLADIVEALERRGCAGVQLRWDGVSPPRERVEGRLFSLLEARRGTAGVPVLLSDELAPLEILRWMADAAAPTSTREAAR